MHAGKSLLSENFLFRDLRLLRPRAAIPPERFAGLFRLPRGDEYLDRPQAVDRQSDRIPGAFLRDLAIDTLRAQVTFQDLPLLSPAHGFRNFKMVGHEKALSIIRNGWAFPDRLSIRIF
jgi:hypothetical protein